jgi:hypothetical protein
MLSFGNMSETLGHCTHAWVGFPQEWEGEKFGNCNALAAGRWFAMERCRNEEWGFAGSKDEISTGLSTPVQKVKNGGTGEAH